LSDGRKPVILRTVATDGAGVPELLEALVSVAANLRAAAELPAAERAAPERTAPERTGASRISLDHLGIAVNALDDSIAFYESLGLAVAHRETVQQEKVRVAMLPTASARIELLEPAAPDSPISKFLQTRGPGLHHVA